MGLATMNPLIYKTRSAFDFPRLVMNHDVSYLLGADDVIIIM